MLQTVGTTVSVRSGVCPVMESCDRNIQNERRKMAKKTETQEGVQTDMFNSDGSRAESQQLTTQTNEHGLQAMPEKDIFEEYGEQVSSRNITGQLLKFSKGDYLAGQDGTEVPIGTKMIVQMDMLMLGWIRWEDEKPADQRMGYLVEGFRPAPRDTLGFGYTPGVEEPDTSEWPLDSNSHQPRDPWVFSYYLILKDPDGGEDDIYTFTTSSAGGKNAIADLCKIYGRKRREGYKDHFPVVALKVGSYTHSNKQFGKIKVPVLPVVGWAAKAAFGDMPAPTDATEQIAETLKDESKNDIPF